MKSRCDRKATGLRVTRLRSSPSCNKAFGTNTNDRSSDSPAEKETSRTGWSHPLRTTTPPPCTTPSPQQTSYRPVRWKPGEKFHKMNGLDNYNK
ncbi:hypothetical protein AVEN_12664-1 [Araneus ventricosus]|uniref:Uncharacterized protein n=1 Tax=Araneus ventricosus TaxID=182803 RepID=A0A4Y2ABM8_ARAVE|nr:hypothetical protein AVEN_12664-1 [Araneus ventricosus]